MTNESTSLEKREISSEGSVPALLNPHKSHPESPCIQHGPELRAAYPDSRQLSSKLK